MILCCSAQHRGSADVDVFYRVFVAAVRMCGDTAKGVKIHCEQIDELDRMLGCNRIINTGASE